jgi:hypothetical protein
METTRNPLTDVQKQFFSTIRNYIGSPFYYFGSIQRPDYIVGESDVDVDIFSYQPEKMARRLLHLLNGPYVSIKRVWWKFDGNEITGYKVKYKRPAMENGGPPEKIKVEFSIYSEEYKQLILEKHRKQIFISPYTSAILLFLKWIFRKNWIYYVIKKQLLSRNDTFVSLPY